MKSEFSAMLTAMLLGAALLAPHPMTAHCDTLSGPVVAAAKVSLSRGDVTPVLKWVKPEYEPEIRSAFARTLRVRKLGPEARELADGYFFETLVRLHRAGEGAPYTGLTSEPPEPVIAASDEALKTGSVDTLVKMIAEDIAAGIRQRFERAVQAQKRANDSVPAGRNYVAAYIELTHYVEGLSQAAASAAAHPGHGH